MADLFTSTVLKAIDDSIGRFGCRNAFCINGKFYSYSDFRHRVNAVRKAITNSGNGEAVGLVPNDDLDTYASIVAIWLEGKFYVPLHPSWPIDRCKDIISQVGISLILDSSKESRFEGKVIDTSLLADSDEDAWAGISTCDDEKIAYVLFTSGSTGRPKGVPVKRKNLSAFVKALDGLELGITEEDRCLQCFELTFDLSVFSYLIPLLKGACVYTVPNNVILYCYISELLEESQLTVALMAPSTITYLRPYFDEIEGSTLRLSLFCGEALQEDVTSEWSACVPNARILNVYGPTEDTIFCTSYEFRRNAPNKSHNGVLSIGKAMASGEVMVLNDEGKPANPGELGELVLLGDQLFDGYWKDEKKTKEVFGVTSDGKRYYKSGDLCFVDDDGDVMYSGRLDFQAKIQGYRVELGEIEFHAREILNNVNVVCTVYYTEQQLAEIAMFIESAPFDTSDLLAKLKERMPSYMIPKTIRFEPRFPLNINGKIDRKSLKSRL